MQLENDVTRPHLLTVSTNYPSRATPVLGTFVRSWTNALSEHFDMTVICPVPYLPGLGRLPRYAHRPRIADREVQEGIEVWFPRFPFVPRSGRALHGFTIFLRLLPLARRLHRHRPIDALVGHFAYPEGLAAILLGRAMRLPVAITVCGYDLLLLPGDRILRRQIGFALRRAGRVLAVSSDLARHAVAFGAMPDRVRTIPNGVDPSLFYPRDRGECRRLLGLPSGGPLVLGVGRLSEEKGWTQLVDAFAALRGGRPTAEVQLAIVGDRGESLGNRSELERQIARLGLQNAVTMPGARPQSELPLWYGAADLFCLPSSREGCPNVVLEALACGTPVLTTDLGDLRETVAGRNVGIVVEDWNVGALRTGLEAVLDRDWDRDRIAELGRQRTWKQVSSEVATELMALVGGA